MVTCSWVKRIREIYGWNNYVVCLKLWGWCTNNGSRYWKECLLFQKNISKEEVAKAIRKLKRGKAAGVDEFGSELLIDDDVIVEFLWRLWMQCWETGEEPEDWKATVIMSLFKGKGNKKEHKNYRRMFVEHSGEISFASVDWTSESGDRKFDWWWTIWLKRRVNHSRG